MSAEDGDKSIGGATPSQARRRDAERMRRVLLALLSSGCAITTTELRIQLEGNGFQGTPHETVYRQLRLLAGRGQIRRVVWVGNGRDVRWAHNLHDEADMT
ncbi:hypothetical protein [Mycobacterium sp. MUNTM1]